MMQPTNIANLHFLKNLISYSFFYIRVLPYLIGKTGMNDLHRLYTIKFNSICHPLLRQFGLKLFWLCILYVRQVFYIIRQSADRIDIVIFFDVIYVFQITAVVFFKNPFSPI